MSFSGLMGVAFRELFESGSTVFYGTYLEPLFFNEEINIFLLFLNSYSLTDL
jgi:hypothetical protein